MEICAFFSTSNTHSLWKRSLKKVSNLLEEYGGFEFCKVSEIHMIR